VETVFTARTLYCIRYRASSSSRPLRQFLSRFQHAALAGARSANGKSLRCVSTRAISSLVRSLLFPILDFPGLRAHTGREKGRDGARRRERERERGGRGEGKRYLLHNLFYPENNKCAGPTSRFHRSISIGRLARHSGSALAAF